MSACLSLPDITVIHIKLLQLYYVLLVVSDQQPILNMVTIKLENTKCLIFVIIVYTMFQFSSAQGRISYWNKLTRWLYFSSLDQIFQTSFDQEVDLERFTQEFFGEISEGSLWEQAKPPGRTQTMLLDT